MRTAVTAYATLMMLVITFVTMANIQINANKKIKLETAANEATYETVLTLRDHQIEDDEDMQKEFIKTAGLYLIPGKTADK